MSDKKYGGFFLSSSTKIPETNENNNNNNTRSRINNYSVPPMSDDQLRLWVQSAAPFFWMDDDDDMLLPQDHLLRQPSFEISSSTKMNPTEKKEVGEREEEEVDECSSSKKKRQRKRSNELQNLNERLRRRKISKKMKLLQDIIPSSTKRDQASTIDGAIKYIQSLEYQVQTMSTSIGYYVPAAAMMPVQPPPLLQPPGTFGANNPAGSSSVGYLYATAYSHYQTKRQLTADTTE